jgi:hypothetical protein
MPASRSFARPVFAALTLAVLPLAAAAQLRPAVLPEEICLVLSNGPFDANVAALIQGRDDFAEILLAAESECPDLATGLIGATATIPSTVPNSDTDGPDFVPPVVIPEPPIDVPNPGDGDPPVEEEEPGPNPDDEVPVDLTDADVAF